MIHDTDRKWWFGASDSQKILTPNHDTKTWQSWWRVKCGAEESDFTGNMYTEAGTRFEHPILECFERESNFEINKDRQLIIEPLRLRVNYDGDYNGYIFEVKTHMADKPFEVSPYIYAQVQTQMYVWKECRDDFQDLLVMSYALTKDDYDNLEPTVDDIDFDRIKVKRVKYNRRHMKHFLKALEPLVTDLREHIKENEDERDYIRTGIRSDVQGTSCTGEGSEEARQGAQGSESDNLRSDGEVRNQGV